MWWTIHIDHIRRWHHHWRWLLCVLLRRRHLRRHPLLLTISIYAKSHKKTSFMEWQMSDMQCSVVILTHGPIARRRIRSVKVRRLARHSVCVCDEWRLLLVRYAVGRKGWSGGGSVHRIPVHVWRRMPRLTHHAVLMGRRSYSRPHHSHCCLPVRLQLLGIFVLLWRPTASKAAPAAAHWGWRDGAADGATGGVVACIPIAFAFAFASTTSPIPRRGTTAAIVIGSAIATSALLVRTAACRRVITKSIASYLWRRRTPSPTPPSAADGRRRGRSPLARCRMPFAITAIGHGRRTPLFRVVLLLVHITGSGASCRLCAAAALLHSTLNTLHSSLVFPIFPRPSEYNESCGE